MRKRKISRQFVKVQVSTMVRRVLNVPADAALRLADDGFLTYRERCNPPYILDPQFDDLALAIPGAFLTRQ